LNKGLRLARLDDVLVTLIHIREMFRVTFQILDYEWAERYDFQPVLLGQMKYSGHQL
jgi:hypothetical protein